MFHATDTGTILATRARSFRLALAGPDRPPGLPA